TPTSSRATSASANGDDARAPDPGPPAGRARRGAGRPRSPPHGPRHGRRRGARGGHRGQPHDAPRSARGRDDEPGGRADGAGAGGLPRRGRGEPALQPLGPRPVRPRQRRPPPRGARRPRAADRGGLRARRRPDGRRGGADHPQRHRPPLPRGRLRRRRDGRGRRDPGGAGRGRGAGRRPGRHRLVSPWARRRGLPRPHVRAPRLARRALARARLRRQRRAVLDGSAAVQLRLADRRRRPRAGVHAVLRGVPAADADAVRALGVVAGVAAGTAALAGGDGGGRVVRAAVACVAAVPGAAGARREAEAASAPAGEARADLAVGPLVLVRRHAAGALHLLRLLLVVQLLVQLVLLVVQLVEQLQRGRRVVGRGRGLGELVTAMRLFLLLLRFAVPFWVLVLPAAALAQPAVPPLTGRVVDLADVLSPATEAQVTTLLEAHEAQTTNQVAVLTIPSLEGSTVEEVANEVFNAGGLGESGRDNGVLLLVARDDRELRIEVGYGLEGALTDAEAGRIIRNVIVPRFREGDFDGGVSAGVSAILGTIEGTYEPPEDAGDEGPWWLSLIFLFTHGVLPLLLVARGLV